MTDDLTPICWVNEAGELVELDVADDVVERLGRGERVSWRGEAPRRFEGKDAIASLRARQDQIRATLFTFQGRHWKPGKVSSVAAPTSPGPYCVPPGPPGPPGSCLDGAFPPIVMQIPVGRKGTWTFRYSVGDVPHPGGGGHGGTRVGFVQPKRRGGDVHREFLFCDNAWVQVVPTDRPISSSVESSHQTEGEAT